MIFNSVGIVVRRSHESNYKCAVIDKQYGKIECIAHSLQLGVGSLIEYSLKKQRGQLFLSDIQTIYVPLSLGSFDLLFLHHIFELIYYFASEGDGILTVFDLLAFLYRVEHMLISVRFKKFFLLKLLTTLGIDSDLQGVYSDPIHRLSAIDIDQFNDELLNEETEKLLDKWLWYCVRQHPYSSAFKTVNFLEKIGRYE